MISRREAPTNTVKLLKRRHFNAWDQTSGHKYAKNVKHVNKVAPPVDPSPRSRWRTRRDDSAAPPAARLPVAAPETDIQQAVLPILPPNPPVRTARNLAAVVSDSSAPGPSGGAVSDEATAGGPAQNPPDNGQLQDSPLVKLQKELKELKESTSIALVDNAVNYLQQLIVRPAGLFDPYAALAALEHVVDVAKEKGDSRGERFAVILRQCRSLVDSPALRSIVVKLVASKEEAEVAKVVEKALKNPAPRRSSPSGTDQLSFRQHKLAEVPRYVYPGSFMSKLDDKPGYDHISLTKESQTYVGFEWEDSWKDCIPWRSEKHAALEISTDASQFRWAAVIRYDSARLSVGDYWEEEVRLLNINVQELWAVAKAIQSLPHEIRDCRLDVHVDNQAAIHTWHGRGSRSRELNRVAQILFNLTIERNISLSMVYVPSLRNEADWFSRKLSKMDSMLSDRCWMRLVQDEIWGKNGHNLDLMSLDSNVMRDMDGGRLRHFTPFPTPDSAGVNVRNQDLSICDGAVVNAYVFPPFGLILPLLRRAPVRFKRGVAKVRRTFGGNLFLPRLIEYKKLINFITSYDVGELLSVPQANAEQEEVLSLDWFGNPEGNFKVAIGADGAPFGKHNEATAWLISFLNITDRVASCDDNFILLGANCKEDHPHMKKYACQLRDQFPKIEEKSKRLKTAKAVHDKKTELLEKVRIGGQYRQNDIKNLLVDVSHELK
ncbi:hypothetical protein QZH41_003402 [Actinostola sp. cb2023]|nr:hypothetical protein QZH41_003402 [Actinostola sp. cb2023]